MANASDRPTDTGAPDILNLVNSRAQHSKSYFQGFNAQLARWYDLWRGTRRRTGQPFRNEIHLNYLISIVESDVARKVQTSFGSWPVVDFSGYAPEDAGKARKNATLISAQMKDCGSFVKAVDFFTMADLYGTAIARDGWRHTRRKEQFRVLDPKTNREQVVDREVTRFDGPDWEPKDRLDVWCQPGKKTFQTMDWVIDRYYLDLDVIEEMGAAGIFDAAGVAKLKQAPMTPEGENDMAFRQSVYRTWEDYSARRNEKFAKPVEVWDMWGRVPSEFAPDGVVFRLVTLGNGRVLLRNRGNPFWHGRIPFYSYAPCPDPHYFDGLGKVEIAAKMQVAANKLVNARLDALDIHGSPTWLVRRDMGIDFQNLYLKPGGIIAVDGPIDDSVIKPLSPDLRGMEMLMQEGGFLWKAMQQATGEIEDTVMGGGGGGRETARAFMGRQENVLTRLMLEARLAEEGFLEPLANGFIDLNRQFLSLPRQIKIMGSAAIVNPVTGLPYPQDMERFDLEDLNHNYHAHAIGATQMLGKSVKQQNMMMLTQAVSQNPVALKMLNWANWFRQVFQTFDITNLNELFVSQVPAINQMADEGGVAPEAMAQQAMQPLDQLNPDLLGNILGGQNPAPIGLQPPVFAQQMPNMGG